MILAAWARETSFREFFCYAMVGHALQEESVDELHRFCLFRIDGKLPVWSFVVAEEALVGNRHLAVCKSLPLAPSDIF